MATFITVTGQWESPDGSGPASGTVRFQLTAALRDGVNNVRYGTTAIEVPLDDNGQISTQLLAPNDPDLDPDGVLWQATIDLHGRTGAPEVFAFDLAHDGESTVDLADLEPATIGPPTASYATAAALSGHVANDDDHADEATWIQPGDVPAGGLTGLLRVPFLGADRTILGVAATAQGTHDATSLDIDVLRGDADSSSPGTSIFSGTQPKIPGGQFRSGLVVPAVTTINGWASSPAHFLSVSLAYTGTPTTLARNVAVVVVHKAAA